MQRLRRLPQGSADHVPDFYRDRRGSDVDTRTRKHHSAIIGTENEPARSVEVRGAGCCAEQLPLLQRLHAGMSVECESRVVESGNASRSLEPRRVTAARTIL